MSKIEFSIPLLFQEEYIKNIERINKEVTKSEITSVYNCFPKNFYNKCGFEQARVKEIEGVNTEEDFFRYVKMAQDIGLEFIYLLNYPRSMFPVEFYNKSGQINQFIEMLLKNNVNIVRVTNTQLIDYLTVNYPELEIRTSTSQEYTNIKQYKNLLELFPNITEVVPSWDLNRNFEFIKTFNNTFEQNLELMVNEGCLPGCPFRTHHNSSIPVNPIMPNIPERFGNCFNRLCDNVYYQNFWQSVALSNIIYPWQIDTYVEKYGVKKFKLVGRNSPSETLKSGKYFNLYESYIKGIEDFDVIKDMPFKMFNHYIIIANLGKVNDITVEQIKDYLPSLEHFEKNGHKCANVCGAECRYCYNLAEKLNKDFPVDFRR